MSFINIPTAWREVGQPFAKQLVDRVSNNLDDLDNRVSSIEVVTGSVIIINEIIQLPSVAVGEQKEIYAIESDVKDNLGATWKLTDGSDVTGSDYATLIGDTALPDPRGRCVRMQDNGAGVDPDNSPLRTNQNDEFKSHSHGSTRGIGGLGPFGMCGGWGSCGSYQQGSATISYTGGSETRPKNTTTNLYTKINYDDFEERRLFRVPQDLTISKAEITTLIAGISGTLEIDILTGSSLASMASIFSTRPTVLQSSGNYTTSTNQVISSSTINANDFIELRVVSLQAGQRNFHLDVFGLPT